MRCRKSVPIIKPIAIREMPASGKNITSKESFSLHIPQKFITGSRPMILTRNSFLVKGCGSFTRPLTKYPMRKGKKTAI
jgi:hypothetical protein